MNLSNIFESTDFVHASGTKEELQVAEFLKAQCEALGVPARLNIINLRLDITHLYYPAKNSFQKGRLKRREIFTELLLYTLTT